MGNTSTPTDKPVLIFDTLLNVTTEGTYKFVLFQTDPAVRPTVLINNQENEPKPEPGFMKIKIINLASNCFPGTVDLLMKMFDYNYGDLGDVDVIKSVKATYGEYEIYRMLDHTISDGGLYFIMLDPATQEPLFTDFIYGPNLLNASTGHFYNVLTLYISEKESATGAITGKNGKQYDVEVKALFSN